MKTPTMRDIANQLNISVCAVSHALNNTGRLSDELRQKILQYAESSGYVLNRNARNLRKQAKNSIGIYVESIEYLTSSFFFSNLMAGILSVTREENVQVYLSTADTRLDFTDFDVQAAVFMHPTENAEYLERLARTKVPFLIIGRPAKDDIMHVDSNNIKAAYDTYNHLLDMGHTGILSVLADKSFTITIDQLTGIKKALDEHGQDFDRSSIIWSDYSISDNFDSLIEKLKSNPHITAVITASDSQALRVMNALKTSGFRVPDDISVACMSGTIITQTYNPPISAAEGDIFRLGLEIGKSACMLVKDGTINQNTIIDYVFHDRGSVKNLNI